MRAWPRWAELRSYENTEGWLYVVAHRVAVSRWRRTRRTVLGWLGRDDDGTHAGHDRNAAAGGGRLTVRSIS
ncbi:MAG: hypothetical protein L0Y54_06670 [Sporichthyaceae bacterium]|nr:hypothetical protein [Sporichthyaceae bacterium]